MKSERLFEPVGCKTFPEVLEFRAEFQAEDVAYRELEPSGDVRASVTFSELAQHARRIASLLQGCCDPGARVLLLYPPGIEFVAAFFGCLYGGLVAVPAPLPDPHRLRRTLPRLRGILKDAAPGAVLTVDSYRLGLESLAALAPELRNVPWLFSGSQGVAGAGARQPWAKTDHLAFIQYSSGSTGIPKGVMVSHDALMRHAPLISHAWAYAPDSVSLTWLPHFHDLGLIEGLLHPTYRGITSYIMSPLDLIQRPARWLQAISRYGVTNSIGPNFAYELCVRRISDEEREGLNLARWRVAGNGAEPVRKDTLERFYAAFRRCGLRWTALYPCYGLAEATLVVSSGGPHPSGPVFASLDPNALLDNRVVELSAPQAESQSIVGCGQIVPGTQVEIVDPVTRRRCTADRVGEIWVRSDTNASGYFGRPEDTAQTFYAWLVDTGEGPFLRTGDTGFLRDGELFVTGRIKDLIIIHGQNLYPQDIEWTVERLEARYAAVRPGGAIAFSMQAEEDEQVVVFQEVDTHAKALDTAAIIADMRQAVSEEHDVALHAVVLIAPGHLPKTSSGKKMRHACRAAFLSNFEASDIEVIARWPAEEPQVLKAPAPRAVEPFPTANTENIANWLVGKLAERLGKSAAGISQETPLQQMGLDSLNAIGLSGDLELLLRRSVSPTILWRYSTVEELARHLAGGSSQGEADRSLTVKGPEPVAIIGMSCRFPGGCDSPEEFLAFLRQGLSAIAEVPKDRWSADALYDPDEGAAGKTYNRHGAFLEGIDKFDAAFFGISPREAACMDPQQRLLLEIVWEALEGAGQDISALAGSRTGVFLGISGSEYGQLLTGPERLLGIDSYTATGTMPSVAAGRLAYALGLNGPTLAVDTACSSSLVAVHLACQSLLAGECTMAVAGGVNILINPSNMVAAAKLRALSPDGHCKTFDADANGYTRAEGCGVIVLKRLSEAVAAGDPILALIRGTAINHDGRSNGLTAPNGAAQAEVVRQALAVAQVAPQTIGYVETHGTGTPLGDPIEVEALGEVLAQDRSKERPLLLGSVKTNIGHLEAAAGIAGLIKTVLSLQAGEILPHRNLITPNRLLHLDELPIEIPVQSKPWPAGPRLAGVSSFGISGTNAHAILEQAPEFAHAKALPDQPGPVLLPLSARSIQALRDLTERYLALLCTEPAPALATLAAAAAKRRSHHPLRLAAVGASTAEMSTHLRSLIESMNAAEPPAERAAQTRRRPVFIFPGQGSQWIGMGKQLLAAEPVFRATLEDWDAAIKKEAGWSLLAELSAGEDKSRLNQLNIIQPILVAIEVALAMLWRSLGVIPAAVVGTSMGEVAAANVAGALSLEDAVRVICRRSELLLPTPLLGGLALVELSAEEAQRVIDECGVAEKVSVAGSNSRRSTLISGATDALEEILRLLKERGKFCRRIRDTPPTHGPQVDSLCAPLEQALAGLSPRPASIPLFSTVTAGPISGEQLTAQYWVQNLRARVQFLQATEGLLSSKHDLFIEMSPHPVLIPSLREIIADHDSNAVAIPSLRKEQDERTAFLEAVGALYSAGYPLSWDRVYPGGKAAFVPLPSYPFDRQRYWAPLPADLTSAAIPRPGGPAIVHPLLGSRLTAAILPSLRAWESVLSSAALPYLADHRVGGSVIFPAAGYLEMALAAAQELKRPTALSQVRFERLLRLRPGEARRLQLSVVEGDCGEAAFRIDSEADTEAPKEAAASWVEHANGALRTSAAEPARSRDLALLRQRAPEQIDVQTFYQQLETRGMHFGPRFRGVRQLWRGPRTVLGQLQLPSALGAEGYQLHPVLLDACIQLAGCLLPAHGAFPYVPTGVEHVQLYRRPVQSLWGVASVEDAQSESSTDTWLKVDLTILDEQGAPVLEMCGVTLQPLSEEPREAAEKWLYKHSWQSAPLVDSKAPGSIGAWLLLGGKDGLQEHLAEALRSRSARCIHAVPGSRFAPVAPDTYQLPLERPEALERLLATVLLPGAELRGIISLHCTNTLGADQDEAAARQQAAVHNCLRVLRLAQALLRLRLRDRPPLWIVTRGAQVVNLDQEMEAPQAAPLWGLGKTLALEHSELQCRMVDLSAEAAAQEVALLAAELGSGADADHIAFRGKTRYVAYLERQRLEKQPGRDALKLLSGRQMQQRPRPAPRSALEATAEAIAASGERSIAHPGAIAARSSEAGRGAAGKAVGAVLPPVSGMQAAAVIRPGGCYLVTGGLSGLGLSVARWLHEQGAGELLLIGRRPPSQTAQAVISELELAGTAVRCISADVAQRVPLEMALAGLRERGVVLRGVIHAAGVLDDSTVLALDELHLASVMTPKVAGAWNLHLVTAGLPLDFFVLFSSAAALLGAPGQANYAAANAFLDALSHYRRRCGLPALSINWGAFSDVGLAADAAAHAARLQQRGMGSLTTTSAWPLMGKLLESWPEAQLGVVDIDARQWAEFYPMAAASRFWSHLLAAQGGADTKAEVGAQLRQAGPHRGRELLETHIREQMARVLRMDPARIGRHTPFGDLGLDSLMSLEVRNRLEASLGLRMSAGLLFTHPTLESLAAHLGRELGLATIAEASPPALEAASLAQIPEASESGLAHIAQLSDEELAALVSRGLTEEEGSNE